MDDTMPVHLRPAIPLGAFSGVRVSEASVLRPSDVDFMLGIVTLARQWPDEPLKSDTSITTVPIPRELALDLCGRGQRGRGRASSQTNWGVLRGRVGHRASRAGGARGRWTGCLTGSGSTACGTSMPVP